MPSLLWPRLLSGLFSAVCDAAVVNCGAAVMNVGAAVVNCGDAVMNVCAAVVNCGDAVMNVGAAVVNSYSCRYSN